MFNTGAEERVGEIEVEAGREYALEVRFSNFKQLNAMSPYVSRGQPVRGGDMLTSSPAGEAVSGLAADQSMTLQRRSTRRLSYPKLPMVRIVVHVSSCAHSSHYRCHRH